MIRYRTLWFYLCLYLIFAVALTISHKTVKSHVSNILSKLHLADRTQAAIYALQQGIADA